MSKRHQISRRRHYGRRQHELHERMDRPVAVMPWPDDAGSDEPIALWDLRGTAVAASGWAQQRGIE